MRVLSLCAGPLCGTCPRLGAGVDRLCEACAGAQALAFAWQRGAGVSMTSLFKTLVELGEINFIGNIKFALTRNITPSSVMWVIPVPYSGFRSLVDCPLVGNPIPAR